MAKRIHFIGCEGVSMKMLSAICSKNGHQTSGSDIALSGHDAKNVEGADTVVYSAAIQPDNPELVRAKQLGLEVLSRAEMLGRICDAYRFSVAVSGTHGKTTTTAMLWQILQSQNPTVHIGGNYNGKFGRVGGSNLFITEACEYKRSFLSLKPDIAIILNTDLDHTDCYKDLDDARRTYCDFAAGAKKLVIANGDDNLPLFGVKKCLTVGLDTSNDYYATCLIPDKKGRYSFCVHRGKKRLGRVSLGVAGRHNVYNALFAVAACLYMGVSFGRISAGLSMFAGAQRRMEFLGYKEGCAVISDYAHHPREIAMSLLSAKESSYRHITAVFEPHTYTRTQSFLDNFVEVLSQADRIVLLPIYAARENPIDGVDSRLIVDGLRQRGKDALYMDSYAAAKQYLNGNLTDDGILLFMGAGTVDTLAREFVNK